MSPTRKAGCAAQNWAEQAPAARADHTDTLDACGAGCCHLFGGFPSTSWQTRPLHPSLPATLAALGLRVIRPWARAACTTVQTKCRACLTWRPSPRKAGLRRGVREAPAGRGTSHGSLTPRPREERPPEGWICTGSWAGVMVSWLPGPGKERDGKTGDEEGGMCWSSHNRPCAL